MELTNDLIAEQVMGWTRKLFGRGKRLEWVDANDIMQPLFYPLDCVGNDCQVFDHVRSKIDERNPAYDRFYEHLSDVLHENPNAGPLDVNEPVDPLYLMHHYRVGDYSRAAMRCVASQKGTE